MHRSVKQAAKTGAWSDVQNAVASSTGQSLYSGFLVNADRLACRRKIMVAWSADNVAHLDDSDDCLIARLISL